MRSGFVRLGFVPVPGDFDSDGLADPPTSLGKVLRAGLVIYETTTDT